LKNLLFLFFFNSFIFADADIYININKDTIFVGDKVQVSIIAKKNNFLKIEFPQLDVDNQDISLSTIFSGDTSLVLSLQFWQPGNHKFPSIQIKTLSEDSIASAFSTDPIDFSILDRIEELDNDLRQSKINKKIHLPFTINQLMLILIIALSIIVVYIFLSKKKKEELTKESLTKVDFFNSALSELDKLVLPEKMKSKELESFYISLSNIIKKYLLAKFFFNATKMTTDEILDYLRINNIPMNGLDEFLQEADLCKFAQKKYGITALLEVKKKAQSLLVDFESTAV
jgi:hypothetical protein